MNKQDLSFCIAGAYLRVLFLDDVDGRHYLETYAPFYVKETKEKLMFTMTVGDGLVNDEPEGSEVGQFDCGGNNHGVYLLPNGGYKMIISNLNGEKACALRTNTNFSDCQISLFGELPNRAFGLNNAMMVAFAFAGAHHNILLMHSSVALHDGRGYLFLGKSGTGKSTHNDLWNKYIPGTEILNDDNPAIRIVDGKPFVCGTPWSGKRNFYRQLSVPIGAYVRLEQAPENIIEKEHKLQGFATILSSCSTMIWDKPSYNAICDTASAVASVIPVFHLKNRPDEEAAKMSFEACTGKKYVFKNAEKA